MKKIIQFGLLLFTFCPVLLFAASETLINTGAVPQETATIAPGAIILLPDNRQAVVMEQLENGNLLTDLDIIISNEGVIVSGEGKGQKVRLDPAFYSASVSENSATIEAPGLNRNVAAATNGKTGAASKTDNKTSSTQNKNISTSVKIAGQPETVIAQEKNPAATRQANAEAPKQEGHLTLAELLPMTNIETGQMQLPKKNPQAPAAQKDQPQKAAPEKTQANRAEPSKKPEKATSSPPRPEKPKAAPRPKAGEEMRIPQEAIKTGKLDFLEGCWQGTRPEYYSKRTIKECFCFGAGGKSGKRRIYDHGRMCIGGTRASLSGSGVLSVTSSGAACNDGEKWGSAEMVCQNSGPKTPCSWVFRDANNGSQSYTIPFVRVDSCGR